MAGSRIKRIGKLNRRTIVPRTKRGPKASVYGDNVKRYGAGEHPTEEEREAIKSEDTAKNSVNAEAGLAGKKFKVGERPEKKVKPAADEDTKKSVNDLAGLGGKKSAAGERPKEATVEVEETTGEEIPKEQENDITVKDPEKPVTETEEVDETEEDLNDEDDEEDEEVVLGSSNKERIPPNVVVTEFIESLTIAKIKEFAAMNKLDLGEATRKADYVEVVSKQIVDRLPNTVLGHLGDLDFGEYIHYLIDACGLEAKEEWLPKSS